MQTAQLQDELERLERQLEAKTAAVQSMSAHSVIKQSYNEHIRQLQREKDELERERLELIKKMQQLQHASGAHSCHC
jgi:hypothetical protein